MAKIPYTKPPLGYPSQLDQLKQRGLVINNDAKALHLLEYLSYYRLSGYWYPLLEAPKSADKFKEGATFEDAFEMYCFDRKMRSLILSELEKIEIAIRAKMIYFLSHELNPFWYIEAQNFRNELKFNKSLAKMKSEIVRSDEEFINKFHDKYSDPLPPSWIAFEVSSFGTISTLYSNLNKNKTRKGIANHFGLNEQIFESWIHTLVYIRNVCAHHSRIWNKELQISPTIPKLKNKKTGNPYPYPSKDWINTKNIKSKRLYMSLSIIGYFLQTINPQHTFKSKLIELFKAYPSINIGAMNIPSDWDRQPLWQ